MSDSVLRPNAEGHIIGKNNNGAGICIVYNGTPFLNALSVYERMPSYPAKRNKPMPHNITTDSALLAKLSAASRIALTREQLLRQRVSFIYGSLPKESTITKHQIESVLSKVEGEPT